RAATDTDADASADANADDSTAHDRAADARERHRIGGTPDGDRTDTRTHAFADASPHDTNTGAADHAAGRRAGDGAPEHHDHARLMTHS
ncbi:MAG TPA: hypothetical protein VGK07_10465, partial [Candidatus Limnocylindria bacterium]